MHVYDFDNLQAKSLKRQDASIPGNLTCLVTFVLSNI